MKAEKPIISAEEKEQIKKEREKIVKLKQIVRK
jgi:hypothetical protein